MLTKLRNYRWPWVKRSQYDAVCQQLETATAIAQDLQRLLGEEVSQLGETRDAIMVLAKKHGHKAEVTSFTTNIMV